MVFTQSVFEKSLRRCPCLSAGGSGAIFIFVSCPIQFLLQRLLQNLRKVDVAFKSSGVEPCRKSDRTVYSFIYICHTDGRHIDVDQDGALITCGLKIRKLRWFRNGLSILFKPEHGYSEQFTGGDESVLLIFSAGCHIKIGKENGDFFAVFIPKYCGVKISFCLFHSYSKIANIKIFVNERFLSIHCDCSDAVSVLLPDLNRHTIFVRKILSRSLFLCARIKIIHLQSALVGKPMDETYNDRPIPVCRGE